MGTDIGIASDTPCVSLYLAQSAHSPGHPTISPRASGIIDHKSGIRADLLNLGHY